MRVFLASYTDNVIGMMHQCRSAIVSAGSAVTGVAVTLACFLALFMIVKSTVDIAGGRPTRFWTVIRPFVLIAATAGFNWAVLGPVDFVAGSMSRGISAMTTNIERGNQAKFEMNALSFNEYMELAEKDLEDRLNKKDSGEIISSGRKDDGSYYEVRVETRKKGRFMEAVMDTMKAFFGYVVQSLVGVIAQLFQFIYYIISTVICTVAQINLAVLTIFGPFVVALSIFPGFDNWKGWAKEYIKVSLWTPMAGVVNFVVQNGVNVFQGINLYTALSGEDTLWQAGSYFTGMVVLYIAGIVMMTRVPQLSNMVFGAGVGLDPGDVTRKMNMKV